MSLCLCLCVSVSVSVSLSDMAVSLFDLSFFPNPALHLMLHSLLAHVCYVSYQSCWNMSLQHMRCMQIRLPIIPSSLHQSSGQHKLSLMLITCQSDSKPQHLTQYFSLELCDSLLDHQPTPHTLHLQLSPSHQNAITAQPAVKTSQARSQPVTQHTPDIQTT